MQFCSKDFHAMSTLQRLIPSLIITFLSSNAALAQSLESQFATLLSWWPGSYDNGQQRTDGEPGAPAPTRLYIREIDLPAFGDHVVYAEWQTLDDPVRVLRQRFYGFEIDRERQALRLNLHIFPPNPDFVARTRGAHENPAKVSDLTPDDMVPLPGCDVYFTWTGDHFAGAMDRGACAFPAPGSDVNIYSWSQMRLTEATFDYLDGWFHLDGSYYRRMSND